MLPEHCQRTCVSLYILKWHVHVSKYINWSKEETTINIFTTFVSISILGHEKLFYVYAEKYQTMKLLFNISIIITVLVKYYVTDVFL